MSAQGKVRDYSLTEPLEVSIVSGWGSVAVRPAPTGKCSVRISTLWPGFQPAVEAAARLAPTWSTSRPSSPNRAQNLKHRLRLATPSRYPTLTELWLPPGSRFDVHTSRLATVSAAGDFGRSAIHNNHLGGCVRIPFVRDLVSATWSIEKDSDRPSLRVVGRSCSIHVDGSRCTTSVDSDGPVRLDRIDASAELTTVLGPGYANEIDGDLVMQSSSGRLEAHLVTGHARLTTDTGSLHHSDIGGTLTTLRIADGDPKRVEQAIGAAGLALVTPPAQHHDSPATDAATAPRPGGGVGSPHPEQRLRR